MVHLSIAVAFAERKNLQEIPGLFYLGNIAPDAIHMREGSTSEDKQRTHFEHKSQGEDLKDLKFLYMEYMAHHKTAAWKWFVKGYFMHVLTDYYWFKLLYPGYVDHVDRLGLSDQEKRTYYYRETDQADFHLFRGQPWRERVWTAMDEAEVVYDFGDLLSADEICRWRDRTSAFFADPTKEPCITPEYFSDALIQGFVTDTAERLLPLLDEWDELTGWKD
jgi:hypothetical protein